MAEYRALSEAEAEAFLRAKDRFVEDLKSGRQPRPGLRVHRVETHPGVWSLTWAPDGRATFMYGQEIRPGQPHVIWRRIGSHAIYDNP